MTDLSSSSNHSSCSSGSNRSSLNNNDPNRRRRVVRFDRIEVLYFPIELGDHPCAIDGPALALSWKPIHHDIYSIKEWERCRRSGPHKRRQQQHEIRLSGDVRTRLLIDNQCATLEQIDVAIENGEKIRKNRMNSWSNSKLNDFFLIAKESFQRKLKRTGGSSSNVFVGVGKMRLNKRIASVVVTAAATKTATATSRARRPTTEAKVKHFMALRSRCC